MQGVASASLQAGELHWPISANPWLWGGEVGGGRKAFRGGRGGTMGRQSRSGRQGLDLTLVPGPSLIPKAMQCSWRLL